MTFIDCKRNGYLCIFIFFGDKYFTKKVLVFIRYLFWFWVFLLDFEDYEDNYNDIEYLILFWGRLAAGMKATAGNGLENGMGMTAWTEYMEWEKEY